METIDFLKWRHKVRLIGELDIVDCYKAVHYYDIYKPNDNRSGCIEKQIYRFWQFLDGLDIK